MQPEPPRFVKGLGLRECLALPAFARAEVRAWPQETNELVTWVMTSEWPVENFVSPNEMVLTTGMGCDTEQLCEMIRLTAASGATVICISTGAGAIHQTLDPEVIEAADASGIALVEMPWQVRFADLSRAVVAALYDDGRVSTGGLPAAFTSPLLSASGVAGIANALEQTTGAPAIVFDATLAPSGTGPKGSEWLAELPAASALVTALSEHAAGSGDARGSDAVPGTPAVLMIEGHGEVAVCSITTSRQLLGWLVVVMDQAEIESLEKVLSYATTAAAIELLRSSETARADVPGRSQFLWELASGLADSVQNLAARAAVLGIGLSTEYAVGVGAIEGIRGISTEAGERDLCLSIQRHLTHPASLVASSGSGELLLMLYGQPDLDVVCSGRVQERFSDIAVTLGFAAGTYTLTALASGVAQARTVRGIARSMKGVGTVGRGEEMQAYLLLTPCVHDEEVLSQVDGVLGGLESADALRRSQLIRTLRAFLEANGNIASAARTLFLNRHSLIYRLRRINELSGLDVADPDDRLVLMIALRIRDLQAALAHPLGSGDKPRSLPEVLDVWPSNKLAN